MGDEIKLTPLHMAVENYIYELYGISCILKERKVLKHTDEHCNMEKTMVRAKLDIYKYLNLSEALMEEILVGWIVDGDMCENGKEVKYSISRIIDECVGVSVILRTVEEMVADGFSVRDGCRVWVDKIVGVIRDGFEV